MDNKEDKPWGGQEIGRRVRQRLHAMEDRRSPLVQESHRLQKQVDETGKVIAQLTTSIGVVEKAGGDATALKAQRDTLAAQHGPAQERLTSVNREWDLVNQVCKWLDMADTGMHWLVFAQSELNKHDKVGVWAPDYHLTRKS